MTDLAVPGDIPVGSTFATVFLVVCALVAVAVVVLYIRGGRR